MIKWILGFVSILLITVIGYTVYTSRAQSPGALDTSNTTSASRETTNPGALNPEATTTTSGSSGNTTQDTPSGSGTAKSSYTLADVAKHKSSSSCWTAINGNVYDVTTWINQHPGGPQAILSLCGTDGSSAFNGQHGTQRRPNTELASFLIGSLAQ
jgi:cytochrome b involved in lipid metabolism